MNESPRPSKEEMGLLHEEALVINDEVDKRRTKVENEQTSNSELATISLALRSERMAGVLEDNPAVRDYIKKNYIFELSSNGVEIYTDPSIDENAENAKPCLEYFQSPDFKGDVKTFKGSLPVSYRKTDSIPAVYIHSKETATKMGFEKSDAYVFSGSNIIKTIHFNSEAKGWGEKFVFFHEYSHILEDDSRGPGIFSEGVANMVAHETLGTDPHKNFLQYLATIKENKLYPLTTSRSNETFNFQLKDLIKSYRLEVDPETNKFIPAIICSQYHFMASFLYWYKNNFDPNLTIVDQSRDTNPNYTQISRKLFEIFPVEMSNAYPKPGERMISGLKSTIPEDLKNFGNYIHAIAISDSDPLVAELAVDIQGKSPEEVAQLCRAFAARADKRFDQIQSEYNTFMDKTNEMMKEQDHLAGSSAPANQIEQPSKTEEKPTVTENIAPKLKPGLYRLGNIEYYPNGMENPPQNIPGNQTMTVFKSQNFTLDGFSGSGTPIRSWSEARQDGDRVTLRMDREGEPTRYLVFRAEWFKDSPF